MKAIDIVKPSMVSQRDHMLPFVGCFGKYEREFAAALYVEACIRRGDKWQPIGPRDFDTTVNELMAERPRVKWVDFGAAVDIVADVRGLARIGWLAMDESKAVQPTADFFAAIARYIPRLVREQIGGAT